MSSVRICRHVLFRYKRRVSCSLLTCNGLRRDEVCLSRCLSNSTGKGSSSSDGNKFNNAESGQSLNRYLVIGGLAVASIGGGLLVYNRSKSGDKSLSRDEGVKQTKEEELKKPVIKDLPESIKYLLIGGGTSSFAAFRSIRANDPKAKVIVISEENHEPYMRPPLSKEFWFSENELIKELKFRQWNGSSRSIYFEHPDFYMDLKKLTDTETGGVSIIKGYKVVDLNSLHKKATLDNGQTIHYEKCLIAPGSRPKNAKAFTNIPADIKSRILTIYTLDDFLKLKNIVSEENVITIVGEGLLGSELACALGRRSSVVHRPTEVYQLFSESGNLRSILPDYLSRWATDKVRNEGAKVIPEVDIKSVQKNGNKLKLELSNGQSLETDYIIDCSDAEPNVDLAKSARLEVDDQLGGYRVNSELQARSDIWVSGAASCYYDVKLGRRRVTHHDHAIISGRLAGTNMTGAGKSFTHQSMFWSDLGADIGFEAIGLIDPFLPTVGVFAKPSPKSKSPSSSGEKADASDSAKSDDELKLRSPNSNDQYEKGIIFYLKNDIIVGIMLWNIFDRISIARRIVNEGRVFEDMSEVAKLFNLRLFEEDEEEEPTSNPDKDNS